MIEKTKLELKSGRSDGLHSLEMQAREDHEAEVEAPALDACAVQHRPSHNVEDVYVGGTVGEAVTLNAGEPPEPKESARDSEKSEECSGPECTPDTREGVPDACVQSELSSPRVDELAHDMLLTALHMA